MPDIIKVREKEFACLLDREKAVSDVDHAYHNQLEMLRELTSYGTNLIPRCYGSSERELKDVVIIGILLRQVVTMLDAVEVLFSNGIVYPAGLQARAIFEASAYIDWILQSDTEKKARYYYVHNLRRQRRWARRTQQGTPEATAFTGLAPDLRSLQDPSAAEQGKKTLQEVDRILLQSDFAEANTAFDNCACKNGTDRTWHYPLGPHTVNALVSEVGRKAEYAVFYNTWSEAMHSSNYADHVKFEKGKVTFRAIRHPLGFDALFRTTAAAALHVYRGLLQCYRRDELPAFARKYKENWQKDLLDLPKIKYEETEGDRV